MRAQHADPEYRKDDVAQLMLRKNWSALGSFLKEDRDYPHVEGGRNPIKRFEDSLAGASERVKQRFYADNFVDLMGSALSR